MKAYAQRSSGNMSKMLVLLKLGVPTPSKVLIQICVAKKTVFGENPCFERLQPNVDPPLGKRKKKNWEKAVRLTAWVDLT